MSEKMINETENELQEVKSEEATEMEVKKPYTFRRLNSTDVFPMFKIIGLIGVNEFASCFEKDAIQKMVKGVMEKGETDGESLASIVGVTLTLDIANIVLSNLPKCEEYIYQLLSQTSNLSVDEVKELDFAVFFEMVVDFIKKEEFKDFIKVASKLFK